MDVDNWIIDQFDQYAVQLGCIAVLIVIFGLIGEAVRREKRKARSGDEPSA